jgi:prephenate dehydrogenase
MSERVRSGDGGRGVAAFKFHEKMIKNAMILGGSGQAGSLLIRSLSESGVAITAVDLHAPAAAGSAQRYVQADVTRFGRELGEEIYSADCVCICLPERVALDSAPRIAGAMAGGALWLDTLSVKGPIAKALEAQARRLEILSINPMFAPALGWSGRPVAVVEAGRSGSKARYFKELLAQWGAAVEPVTAEEHDRLTAALQVATHAAVLAFGSALVKLDYDIEATLRLATPPHRILLGLLYRMITQNAEVYWDIQAYHPHAAAVREDMMATLNTLQSLTSRGDLDGFNRLFQEVRSLLGPSDNELASLTRALIEATKQIR